MLSRLLSLHSPAIELCRYDFFSHISLHDDNLGDFSSAWMIGTVVGHFEQNILPVATELVSDARVVLRHESTDVTQIVDGGAVQSNDEVFKRSIQYHMW